MKSAGIPCVRVREPVGWRRRAETPGGPGLEVVLPTRAPPDLARRTWRGEHHLETGAESGRYVADHEPRGREVRGAGLVVVGSR